MPESRWNDRCLDCVHTIQGTCPIERAVKLFHERCGMGLSLDARIGLAVLAELAPYHGPCEMYWPRVRQVK